MLSMSAPRSVRIDGIATFTMLRSRMDMNIPVISTASGRPHPGPGVGSASVPVGTGRAPLLEAAREVMREQGLDASLGEIARRAGVGNATLYRHFPTREALCEAVFAEYGNDLERIRERVLRIPDAWDALVAWLEETCAECASDQAFADLVTHGMTQSPALNEVCEQGLRLARTLLENAQRQGAVRSDIELTGLLFIMGSLQP